MKHTRIFLMVTAGAFIMGAYFLAKPAIWFGTLDNAPGSERNDLRGLEPHFKAKLGDLIESLAKQGYPTYVRAGLRDQLRQDYWLKKGYTRTLKSKHLTGQAVDLLYNGSFMNLPAHIRYFHLLEKEATTMGLCPGASWSRSNWFWAKFDLGGDPAHVEICAKRTP